MNSVSTTPSLTLPAFHPEEGLRPETLLLLSCARLTIDSEARAEIGARIGSDLEIGRASCRERVWYYV